jgi:hypothetical protein
MRMTDLKDRFSLADQIDTRDLWGEARRRAAAPEAPPRALEWPPSIGRRIAIVGVAFAVFAVAMVFAWDLSHPEPGPRPRPLPAVDLASELPIGWSELPAPPEVRSGAVTAWTGSQLLVWGGYEYVGSGDEDPASDGFVFDGATRAWEVFPDSPLSGRSDMASAWTGEELLIWGGFDGGFREVPYFDDGAAFDSLTETWRMLPAAPIGARTPFSVWTGRELIVWGSADRFARLRDGAAYDPITNSWRTIADGPIDITDGSASWSGQEMIVFGAALDGNNHSDTPTAVGAAYDPDSDTWRELPPSELSPQAHTAQWVGDELIAWDYEHGTAAYDPNTNTWRALSKVPLSFAECGPESVGTAELVVGNYCGRTVVFSSEKDAWHREPIPDLEGEGCCRVLEPVAAGDVVLVPSHSYGMGLGEPDRRMFAYNPPEVIQADARGEVLEPEPFIPKGAVRDGDLIRLPVVFPDGSRATLVYPIPLDLATRGIQPDISYVFEGEYQGPIVFFHDEDASIARFVEGDAPIGQVGPNEVEIWRSSSDPEYENLSYPAAWLRYQLRSWTVLLPLQDPNASAEVDASINLRETATGFPLVGAFGEAELAEGHGESGGAELAFGDRSPEPFAVSHNAIVSLSPDGCSPATNSGPRNGYGSSCLGGGSVFASIYADREFVARVIDGLRVEDFRQT